jgi:hypothetical protein
MEPQNIRRRKAMDAAMEERMAVLAMRREASKGIEFERRSEVGIRRRLEREAAAAARAALEEETLQRRARCVVWRGVEGWRGAWGCGGRA